MAKHNIFGQKGENAAFEALLAKGYLIRDRNWRSGKNEIDIVAEKDNVLLICKKEDSAALVRKFVNEVQIKKGEKYV